MAKVKKGVLAQGTKVFIVHNQELTQMDCIKAIALGDDSVTDIDDTCLDEEEVQTSTDGLIQPGEGSLTIDIDPENQSHVKLLSLAESKEELGFYVGWSDGKSKPTITTPSGEDGSNVDLPKDRSFTTFRATVRTNSPTFEANSLVGMVLPMKRKTKVTNQLREVTA